MTTFNNVFGGGVISPAQDSYISYTLTANLALVWPQETAPNSNLAAQIIELSAASTGSFSVTLPAANMVSNGQFLLFVNLSAFPQAVLNNAGQVVIASLAPGAVFFVYVQNNSTTAGVWNSFQYGAQVSVPSVAAIAGAGLLPTGATLSQDIVVKDVVANYVSTINDRAILINWEGGSGSVTSPLVATVGASYYFHLRNSGTSVLTLVTSGSDLVNGVSSLAFNPGDSAFIVTDGIAWFTIGLGPAIAAAFNFISINVPSVVSGAGIVTLSGVQLNQVAYKFTGALTQNTIIDLPPTKQQYWVSNATTGAFTLTIQVPTVSGMATPAGAVVPVPQGINVILYSDGTNVITAVSGTGLGNPVPVNQGGTGATTASSAVANLGGTSIGSAVFTATTNAGAQQAIAAPSTADAFLWGAVL